MPQVAFVLVRLVLRRATAGRLLYAGFGLTSILYAVCWSFISKALCELPVLNYTACFAMSG